jgi:hypothetical protein
MPLEVTSIEFANELKACFENRDHDATKLLKIVDPFLIYWSNNLIEKKRDIHMVSLLRLLSPSIEESIAMINAWTEGITGTHSLYEELQEVFLEELRNMKYWPAQAKPIMVEYVVALAFKRRLKDLIKCYRPVPIVYYDLQETSVDNTDWFLLKVIKQNPWYQYLIESLLRGYNAPTISEITHISEDTIRNDMRELWRQFSTDKQHSAKQETKPVSIKKA